MASDSDPGRWDIPSLAALAVLDAAPTVAAAADELAIAPGAVLDRIGRLEAAAGHPLLDRDTATGAPVPSLNAAGRLLAEHATMILGALERAREELAAIREGRCGTVCVGVAVELPPRLVAALTAELARMRGGFRCVVETEAGREACLAALADGRHDVALVAGPPPARPLEGVELLPDPWVLVVPASSPLAEAGAVPSEEELAALPRVDGGDAGAQALVAAGLGVAILPCSSVDEGHPDTVAIALGDRPPRPLALAWRAGEGSAPPVSAAREAAASVCAQVAARRALLAQITTACSGAGRRD